MNIAGEEVRGVQTQAAQRDLLALQKGAASEIDAVQRAATTKRETAIPRA
jgi:hypothetical protein